MLQDDILLLTVNDMLSSKVLKFGPPPSQMDHGLKITPQPQVTRS